MTSTVTLAAGPRGGLPGGRARDLVVDWDALRTQKAVLVALRAGDPVPPAVRKRALDGLIHALDDLQDAAVDALGVPEDRAIAYGYPWEPEDEPRGRLHPQP